MTERKILPKKKPIPRKSTGSPGRFISINLKQKKISFNDIVEDYGIGELLIAFLDMDFQAFDQRRQELLANLKTKAMFKKRQSYVEDWLLKEMEELRGQHPYFRIIDEDIFRSTHYQTLLDSTFDLVKIQKLFKAAIEFCLCRGYMSELESLSTLQRYYVYHALNDSPFEVLGINTKVLYEPMKIRSNLTSIGESPVLSDLLQFVKDDEDLLFTEQYLATDVASLLYVEFSKMVVLDLHVKVCGYCGRFFALLGLRPARYCNRPVCETGYTCRTLSATQNYKEKMSIDQGYKIYRAAYKRLNVRKNKNLITSEEYGGLTEKIAGLRRDLQDNKIKFDDYKSQMDSI